MTEASTYYRHGLRRMTGRRTEQEHRAATPLELLFDLTFVAAFGVAGNELAHGIAEGHWLAAAGAFAFAMGAIVWAWINYSWFASAFDTDDWLYRVMTMVQMTGVIVLAIGIPPMFASIAEGEPLDNGLLVAGYVVMRLAMVGQWLRAARSDPRYRTVALTYALFVGTAQILWIFTAIVLVDVWWTLLAAVFLWILELCGPIVAESKGIKQGVGTTPWHPDHIAERYGLLAIVALGETVLGTLSAAQAISSAEGWWWTYFLVPSAPVLAVDRSRSFPWGYGHIFLFGSIAGIGAGLHVIAYVHDDHYHVSTTTAILAIAAPVLIYMLSTYLIHAWLVRTYPRNSALQLSVMLLPVGAIALSVAGAPLWLCLMVVLASPVSLIVSYETGGWRTLTEQLEHVVSRAPHA